MKTSTQSLFEMLEMTTTCVLYPRRIVLIESFTTLRMGIVRTIIISQYRSSLQLYRSSTTALAIKFCFSKLTIHIVFSTMSSDDLVYYLVLKSWLMP